jgi:hypothetical protein
VEATGNEQGGAGGRWGGSREARRRASLPGLGRGAGSRVGPEKRTGAESRAINIGDPSTSKVFPGNFGRGVQAESRAARC